MSKCRSMRTKTKETKRKNLQFGCRRHEIEIDEKKKLQKASREGPRKRHYLKVMYDTKKTECFR